MLPNNHYINHDLNTRNTRYETRNIAPANAAQIISSENCTQCMTVTPISPSYSPAGHHPTVPVLQHSSRHHHVSCVSCSWLSPSRFLGPPFLFPLNSSNHHLATLLVLCFITFPSPLHTAPRPCPTVLSGTHQLPPPNHFCFSSRPGLNPYSLLHDLAFLITHCTLVSLHRTSPAPTPSTPPRLTVS